MFQDFSKILKGVSAVKFAGGMFASLCTVIVVLIVALGILAALSRNTWVIAGTIGLTLCSATYLMSRMIRFAETNPAAAVLASSQYLKHAEIVMQASKTGKLLASVTIEEPPAIEHEGQNALPTPEETGE